MHRWDIELLGETSLDSWVGEDISTISPPPESHLYHGNIVLAESETSPFILKNLQWPRLMRLTFSILDDLPQGPLLASPDISFFPSCSFHLNMSKPGPKGSVMKRKVKNHSPSHTGDRRSLERNDHHVHVHQIRHFSPISKCISPLACLL